MLCAQWPRLARSSTYWQWSLQWRHMSTMASQITSLTIVYSTVYSGTDQRKHKSSASLAFVQGIHRWPVNSPHKGPVTREMFPFADVNMISDNSCKWFFSQLTPRPKIIICAGKDKREIGHLSIWNGQFVKFATNILWLCHLSQNQITFYSTWTFLIIRSFSI